MSDSDLTVQRERDEDTRGELEGLSVALLAAVERLSHQRQQTEEEAAVGREDAEDCV